MRWRLILSESLANSHGMWLALTKFSSTVLSYVTWLSNIVRVTGRHHEHLGRLITIVLVRTMLAVIKTSLRLKDSFYLVWRMIWGPLRRGCCRSVSTRPKSLHLIIRELTHCLQVLSFFHFIFRYNFVLSLLLFFCVWVFLMSLVCLILLYFVLASIFSNCRCRFFATCRWLSKACRFIFFDWLEQSTRNELVCRSLPCILWLDLATWATKFILLFIKNWNFLLQVILRLTLSALFRRQFLFRIGRATIICTCSVAACIKLRRFCTILHSDLSRSQTLFATQGLPWEWALLKLHHTSCTLLLARFLCFTLLSCRISLS